MSLPPITVVVGIDFKTLQQLEVSYRTWKLYQPQMYEWPWIVFSDGTSDFLSLHAQESMKNRGVVPFHAKFLRWPQCAGLKKVKAESQREFMLAGHVWVPALHVETEWYCKIDTDALATRPAKWPEPGWFHPHTDDNRECVVVAPRWTYTKGIDFLKRLDDWGDTAKIVSDCGRMNIQCEPNQLRVGHPRWCSWNSFYRTSWAREAVELLRATGHEGTLPIPSQDTFHWYVAERGGKYVRTAHMKKCGWNNYPKITNLIETAQAIMRGEQQEQCADA